MNNRQRRSEGSCYRVELVGRRPLSWVTRSRPDQKCSLVVVAMDDDEALSRARVLAEDLMQGQEVQVTSLAVKCLPRTHNNEWKGPPGGDD